MKLFDAFMLSCVLTLFLGSCNRKTLITGTDNEEQYKKYSRQIEAEYTASENMFSASATAEPVILPENMSHRELTEMREETKVMKKNVILANDHVKTTGNKLVNKIMTKRVEKLLKKQESKKENADSGNIIGGIIIGALGLILIGVAAGTAAPTLVFVGGAVLFVAGVILLLSGVL